MASIKSLTVVLITIACQSSLPRQQALTATDLTQANKVQVYLLGQTPPEYQVIGPVEGQDYQIKVSHPSASSAQALARMRLQALELGADAVVEVVLQSWSMLDRPTGCMTREVATGLAVVLSKPGN